MGNLGKTYKLKHREKYDTDRYEERYFFVNERFEKTVWEGSVFVGPGAYNMGYIDNVLTPRKNDASDISSAPDPFFTIKVLLSKERAKFKP